MCVCVIAITLLMVVLASSQCYVCVCYVQYSRLNRSLPDTLQHIALVANIADAVSIRIVEQFSIQVSFLIGELFHMVSAVSLVTQ